MNKTIKQKIITYNKIKQSPVTIGVLLPPYISNTKTNIKAYLDPTYVKWLSKAKAAVVPIMYNLDIHILINVRLIKKLLKELIFIIKILI